MLVFVGDFLWRNVTLPADDSFRLEVQFEFGTRILRVAGWRGARTGLSSNSATCFPTVVFDLTWMGRFGSREHCLRAASTGTTERLTWGEPP